MYPTCSGDDDLVSVGSLVERMIGNAGGAFTESFQFSDAAPKGLTAKMTGPAPAARSREKNHGNDVHIDRFRMRAGSVVDCKVRQTRTSICFGRNRNARWNPTYGRKTG